MATETWTHHGGRLINTAELFKLICAAPHIEGVTFLGGEPFEQPSALAELAANIKSQGLSLTVFTGFTYEELRAANNAEYHNLLGYTDLLIDGAFVQAQFDLSRPWVGSKNQQYRFLTNRYSKADISNIKNQIEVRIATNGTVLVNGMGDFSQIKTLLQEN
jgi:anaerobic ribonucleoside-triphosphate reductase activating protein